MHEETRRILFAWFGLLALLALTCASAWWPIGGWNSVVNLSVATLKTGIVAIVFMHLRSGRAIRACVLVTVFVLMLIFALGGSDYATRELHLAPWQEPELTAP